MVTEDNFLVLHFVLLLMLFIGPGVAADVC